MTTKKNIYIISSQLFNFSVYWIENNSKVKNIEWIPRISEAMYVRLEILKYNATERKAYIFITVLLSIFIFEVLSSHVRASLMQGPPPHTTF